MNAIETTQYILDTFHPINVRRVVSVRESGPLAVVLTLDDGSEQRVMGLFAVRIKQAGVGQGE